RLLQKSPASFNPSVNIFHSSLFSFLTPSLARYSLGSQQLDQVPSAATIISHPHALKNFAFSLNKSKYSSRSSAHANIVSHHPEVSSNPLFSNSLFITFGSFGNLRPSSIPE